MGKASRRKRIIGDPVAVGGGSARGAAAVRGGSAARVARQPVVVQEDSLLRYWELALAVVAGSFWFLGHVPGPISDLAIPAWVVTGLALGLVSPWYGLLLTVITVPWLGGATDQPTGEILRVVAMYGAAIRVLLDRFILDPALGRTTRHGPPLWVLACAALAAVLYAVTVQTGTAAVGGDPAFFQSGIRWVVGGSMGMMMAWIAASHVVAGREDTFTDVVLAVLVVASALALAAYFTLDATAYAANKGTGGASTMPVIQWFTFYGRVNDRLAGLGYPTPTAMGIVVSLPFAVAAAWRQARWLAGAVIVLALVVVMLTVSRGPLIAIGAGAIVAVLASGRFDRRLAIPALAVGGVAAVGIVLMRYGTDPSKIVENFLGASGEDTDRIGTWVAAVHIAIGNPIVGGGWRSVERYADFAQRQVAYAHDIVLHGFSEGGFPLGITNGAVILYSAWMVWVRRHTMAVSVIAAAVTFFVCGLWDIPQVRAYASTMGGIAMGMAAGPLIARRAAAAVPATVPARAAAAVPAPASTPAPASASAPANERA